MDSASQVRAAREAALAVPRDDLVTLVVTGNDRVTWLNGLVTCDVAKATPDRALYGLAVGRNGRVLADLTVVVDPTEPRLLVAVPRTGRDALKTHLDHYIVMEDVELADGGFHAWAIHGPKAPAALAAAREAGAIGGELDATGLGGAFVLAQHDLSEHLARHAVVGDEAGWEALRLERGVPRFGVDFTDQTYPQEASLERAAVAFDKGCYLGQEVVFMLEKRGHVKRKVVPVVVDSTEAPPAGAAVTDEAGAPAGEITSALVSPTLGKAVALAMIKRAHAAPGQAVMVLGARGQVVERPA
jgi:folate-binding protein YgfZ